MYSAAFFSPSLPANLPFKLSEAKKERLDFKFSSFTFSVGLSSTQSAINTLVSLGLD